VLLDLGKVPKLDETVGMGRGREVSTGNTYELFLAEVSVNGSAPVVLWCAPYQADVTKLLRVGENELEIHVINTWHNWRVATQYPRDEFLMGCARDSSVRRPRPVCWGR